MANIADYVKIAEDWLSTDQYYEMLINFTQSCSRTSSELPVSPKPSEIYLIYNENKEDWKSDQHRWKLTGIKHLPGSNPKLTCSYFKCYSGEGFWKRAYMLYNGGSTKSEIVLLHYTGSLDKVVHNHHGNRKHNLDRKHVMTAKSQLRKQKVELNQAPHKTYKKLVLENVHPALEPVLLPRDRKQVSNAVAVEREKKLISSDDVYGLYLLNTELDGFVSKLELLPDFYCILFDKGSLQLFFKVSHIENIILNYDTTFNLGDFYVSILTYRFIYFSENPVIPLFYIIHDTKKQQIHDNFFTFVKNTCGNHMNGKIFVTDREAAIVGAIKNSFPTNTYFFCWNHIQQDVKHWIKHHNGTNEDISVYTKHIWNLLDSSSYDEYLKILDKMKNLSWNKEFLLYYERNIEPAVIQSGKWKLMEFSRYTPGSGITINPAESFNAVLKRLLDWREVKAQILALTLYYLDIYTRKEICRGFYGRGNYSLKKEYKHLSKNSLLVEYPQSTIPLDKLPYIFVNKDFSVGCTNDNDNEYEVFSTNYALAKRLIVENKVHLISNEQIFIITVGENKKEMVTLFPTESCTCKIHKKCYHITAARLSIGIDEQKSKHIHLSKVIKRKRGFKSGKKKYPNVSVVESGQSVTIKEKDQTTFLIPTKVSLQGKVKDRFYATDKCPQEELRLPLTSTPERDKTEETLEETLTFGNISIINKNSKDLTKEINLISVDDVDVDEEDVDDTFCQKVKKGRPFQIFGRTIYFSHLYSLVPEEQQLGRPLQDTDFHLVDSIFNIFYPILVSHSKIKPSVNIFPVEVDIISNLYLKDIFSPFSNGLNYFFKYRVPEYDIQIFPLIKYNHCVTIIFIRKHRYILYLDTLGSILPKDEIRFIMKLYSEYFKIKQQQFSFKDWLLFVPKDVPTQENSYDCGVYSCLFIETLLTGNKDLLTTYLPHNSMNYRKNIKNVIIDVMKNNSLPGPKSYHVNKSIKNIKEPESLELSKIPLPNISDSCPPNFNSTIEFLSSVVVNYWDEDTTAACRLGTYCFNVGNKMILCEKCYHWYHPACIKLKKLEIGSFVCAECQKC